MRRASRNSGELARILLRFACRTLTGFVFGGLDTQIEHHLFPMMPRANLRRSRELVRPFCAEHLIAYAEQSPWRAYGEVLHHLRVAGIGAAIPTIG